MQNDSSRRMPHPRAFQPILKTRLDSLYASYNRVDSATDPIQLVRRFDDPRDREVAAFCASALAFGRVASVLQSLERLFGAMGRSPAEFAGAFDVSRHARALHPIVHRWTNGDDLVALMLILKRMLAHGSIEQFFLEGYTASEPDLSTALESFSTRALTTDLRPAYGKRKPRPGVAYFFHVPRPAVRARGSISS